MDFNNLPEHLASARQLLFTEGHLNEGFMYLEDTEKDCNAKNFVQKCVYIFCGEAEGIIINLEEQLKNTVIDLSKLKETVTRLGSYINTVGAGNMLTKVNHLRQLVMDLSDTQSLKNALMELKLERERFERVMDDYFLTLYHSDSHPNDMDTWISAGLLDPSTIRYKRL